MIFSIDNLLTPEEVQALTHRLSDGKFIDGKRTAGWHAQLVKNNTQLDRESETYKALVEEVREAFQSNFLFQIAVQPKRIHSLLFSRYEAGMSYGSHTDNALMGTPAHRSDVSMTLFLSPPESYEGGELVIEEMGGDRPFKLPAGSAIVYPSSTMHRVEPVTSGIRLAAVGWTQSLVRDPAQREILFELDTVRRAVFERQGKTVEFDLLTKSHTNLLRMWAEP